MQQVISQGSLPYTDKQAESCSLIRSGHPVPPCQAINSDLCGSAPPKFDQITLMGVLAEDLIPSIVKKPETRQTKANERGRGVGMDSPEKNSFVPLFTAVARRNIVHTGTPY